MLLENESYASTKRIRGLPDSESGAAMFAMVSACDEVDERGTVGKASHLENR